MKKLLKVALVLALAVASAISLTACGSIDGISIEKEGTPQVVYVLGQDLDLSKGAITVKDGDKTETVDLSSSDVSVTGYNKDQLGEQTLTVEYKDKTTTYTVTVVERVAVSSYISDYFVDDSFDASKGRLKITRDDGTSYTVFLSDDKVSIEGFNSSSVGSNLPVTVRYVNGDINYTGTFKVNIFPVESVRFTKPNKVAYDSHETTIDLTGAYLSLTGNNGALEKDVPVTIGMISGFNPSLATVENKTTPLTQVVSVLFNNETYPFDIKVTYTDVTLIKSNAALLSDLDWTGEDFPEISQEKGEIALETAELYFGLSATHKTLITEDEALTIMRAAMVYGYDLWIKDADTFASTFVIDYGSMYLTCDSYGEVEADIAELKNANRPFYTLSTLLGEILENYADTEVIPGTTFSVCPVIDTSDFDTTVIPMLEFMLDVYDALKDVPKTWEATSLNSFATEIEAAYELITTSDYNDASFTEIYYHASKWRENDDDYFEILYTYYYNKNDTDAIAKLSQVRLPKSLEEIYNVLVYATGEIIAISNQQEIDNTDFLYYYYKAINMAEAIKNGGSDMDKFFYENVSLNSIIDTDGSVESDSVVTIDTLIEFLKITDGGYYSICNALLGDEEFHDLLDLYVETVTKYKEDNTYVDTAEYGQKVEEIFNGFVGMSSTKQLNFISAINTYYALGIPELAFDYSEGAYSYFVAMVLDQYHSIFSDEASYAVVDNLLLAIEYYAQRYQLEAGMASFTEKLNAVTEGLSDLSTEDAEAFNTHLGEIYQKYLDISLMYADSYEAPQLSAEWNSVMEDLNAAMVNVELSIILIQQEGAPLYGFMLSAFERATTLVEKILTEGTDVVKEAYYYKEMYILAEDNPDTTDVDESVKASLEYIYNSYRAFYIEMLNSFGEYSLYDYITEDLKNFYNLSYDLFWTYLYRASNIDPSILGIQFSTEYSSEKIAAAMLSFAQLTVEEQTVFVIIEGESGYYYTAMDAFIEETMTESAIAVVEKLLIVEQAYIMYQSENSDENKTALTTALNDLTTSYNALTGEDKTSFDILVEVYNYYVSVCGQVIA